MIVMLASLFLTLTFPFLLGGCAVVTVAGAAVSVVATGVKITAKTAGAAVDLVIPDEPEKQ